MRRFRWSTTLLLIGAAAGLLALAAFNYANPAARTIAILLALGLILVATLFGKQSV